MGILTKPGIGLEDWGDELNDALDHIHSDAQAAQSAATTAQSTATTAQSTANSASTTASTASTNASTALTTANAASNTANSISTTANAANTLATNLNSQVNTANTGLAARVTNLETLVGTPGQVKERPWEVVVTSTSQSDVQAAISAMMAAPVGNAVQKTVILPPGTFNITAPWFPDAGGADTGLQRYNVAIKGSGIDTTTVNLNLPSAQLIHAKNPNFRWFTLSDMSIKSQNSANRLAYLYSTSVDSYNESVILRNLRFTGNWDYVLGLDGGASANLNSEFILEEIYTGTDCDFGTAFFWSGMSNTSAENQFVNYWIRNCIFYVDSGTLFKFDKGGQIHFSDSTTSAASSSSGAITWFHFPSQNSGNPGVTNMNVKGVRFEPKASNHVILDCSWGGGQIHFDTCTDDGSLRAIHGTASNDFNLYKVNGANIWGAPYVGPVVRFTNHSGSGYASYTGGAQHRGGFIFDGCTWYRSNTGGKADEIQGGTQPILRWSSGAANYDFRSGFNHDDLKSWSIT